jgi:hypothetical protein
LEQLVLIELKSLFGSADRIASTLALADDDLATTQACVEAAQQFAKSLTGDSTAHNTIQDMGNRPNAAP